MAEAKIAVLGGGCFWCLEAVFSELRGVLTVKSGYAGGAGASPTYKQVCTGTTGHAEVIRVTYDPELISYADLLRVFFTTHDPTTRNRQGNDVGTQYRSVIFTADAAEAATAREVAAEIDAARVYSGPVVTEIAGPTPFWPAEAEHDDYFARNPWSGYCQVVIAPKVQKLRKQFADRLRVAA